MDDHCVRDECFGLFLFCLCTSSSPHLIKVTEQNLAFAAVPKERPAHAAELLCHQVLLPLTLPLPVPTPCHGVGG